MLQFKIIEAAEVVSIRTTRVDRVAANWLLLVLTMLVVTDSLAAVPPRIGEFRVEQSPTQLFDESAKNYADILPVDEKVGWDVFVPPSYDPSRPAGILIYISPSASGAIPKRWVSLLSKHNLIWIGARRSGNSAKTQKRMVYALMALALIKRDYVTDPERVFLSGFSGGGRVASLLAVQYPLLFKGAIYNCGANMWENASERKLELLQQNRYVFITGRKDFNFEDTISVYDAYKRAGIEHVHLSVAPLMGHRNPNKKHFDEAILFLDTKKADN